MRPEPPPRPASPKDVLQTWMDSPGHRANLLQDNVAQLGMGMAVAAGDQPDRALVVVAPAKFRPALRELPRRPFR